jgi:16S rRNA (cytosine1402-N4)-methyltransferase
MLRASTSPRACAEQGAEQPQPPHVRRPRYSGRYPRTFADKHKERASDVVTVGKIEAKGNTAVGTHRPICVQEILTALNPQPGGRLIDCTLGYGGHARELLRRVAPAGHVYGFDADVAELRKTEARLEAEFPGAVTCFHSNYAAVARVVLEREPEGVDGLLADLGVRARVMDTAACLCADASAAAGVKHAARRPCAWLHVQARRRTGHAAGHHSRRTLL